MSDSGDKKEKKPKKEKEQRRTLMLMRTGYINHMTIEVKGEKLGDLLELQKEICLMLNERKVHFAIHFDDRLGDVKQKVSAREFNDPIPFPERGLTEDERERLLNPVPKQNQSSDTKIAPLFTEEDLRAALNEVICTKRGGVEAAQNILKKFNIARVSQVPKDKQNEFMGACTIALHELSKEKKS